MDDSPKVMSAVGVPEVVVLEVVVDV
jgi:ABC-type Na+ efflux pump permease subunit